VVNDSIFSLENKILEIKNTATATSELGPLKYLSTLTGIAMDRIINWYILVIIFVFDPLAIALVIAANFAFSQLRRTPEHKLTEEDKEWLEANLESKIEEPKQTGVPVMVDPKTGKFYYEEQELETKNLDLDGDGVVEEEELKQVFDEADINNDGFIDEQEAKAANLDTETTEKLNQLTKSLEALEKLNNENNYDFQWKKDKTSQEIKNIKELVLTQFQNKKDDEDTITYF
jgi:hypothetical protein